jgi:hydrogenase-4 component B
VTTLLAVGAAVLAVGALLPILPIRLGAGVIATTAQIAGLLLIGAAAAASLLDGSHAGSPFRAGIAPAFGIDPLSAFFLVLLGVSSVPALVFAGPYLAGIEPSGSRRALSSLMAAFLLSLIGVLLARSVTVFLACWELMTMLPAAAILIVKRDAPVRSAVYAYVAITHLAGAGVWVAVLVAAHHGALGHPQALAHAGSAVPALIAVAALIGFGAKAGLIPLHSWLPRAHPVAPAPLSALMSGTMVKVALYGLIRIEFDSLPARPLWLALTLLALGLISAVGGVLWAAAQRELKRLLAYSTVENVGIVALALAAAMLLQHAGDTLWAQIAFAAALLHSLNHALFKTLLFLGAGAFERAAATLELEHLGGLLRRMPWTGGAFLIGALAISGLPPLNGFASEWLVLQSLLHATLHGPLGIALAAAAALAGAAAAAALALLCFVKVSGLVLLGAPRSERAARATDAPLPMRVAVGLLAAGCVLLGIAPGLLLPRLARLLSGAVPTAPLHAHVGLPLPATGALPTAGIALALLLLTALLWTARGFRAQQRAAAPSWACGQPLIPDLLWSAPAFTKPLRLVLQGLMRPRRELEVVQAGGLTQRIVYTSHTPSLIDRVLYEPTIRVALAGAAVARRLQTGNVRTYAAYLGGLAVLAMVLLGAGAFR